MDNSQIKIYLNKIRDYIHSVPAIKKVADVVEEKTKVQAEFYAVGLGVLFLLMLFSGFGADIICHITAFAFPFYETIKSLEQNNVDGQSSWLKYWVVCGFLGVIENFADILHYWIPFFYPLKFTFVLWCFLPQFKGSDLLYKMIVLPTFQKHQDVIDSALKSVDKAVLEKEEKDD